MKKKCIIILFSIIALSTLSSIAYSENDELVELQYYQEHYKKTHNFRNKGYPKTDSPDYQKLIELGKKQGEEAKALAILINNNREAELKGKTVGRNDLKNIPKFDVYNYPLIDGSTSAIPLSLILACKIMDLEYRWIRTDRIHERAVGVNRLVAADNNKRLNDIVTNVITKHTGTNTAYMNLIDKKVNILLVARKPSEDELKAAQTAQIEFEYVPIARDAFVFIENRINPMRCLTTEKIKGIYSGKYINWQEIGGENIKITAFQRERNSGSQEMMISEFMKDTPIKEPLPNLVVMQMDGPYFGLTEQVYGIAYSVYYYEHFQAVSPYTRLIEVDGVLPSYETIRTKHYPYSTDVYAVIRKDELKDSPARILYQWLQTEDGQKIVRESGYVPVY